MVTATVYIETLVPEDVCLTLRANRAYRQNLSEQFKSLFAIYAYQNHLLSLGKAALFAGMGRWEFIDFLSENKIPVIDFDEEDLEEEYKSVEYLANELSR